MSFKLYNVNPHGRDTNDCTVRAIALVMNKDWDTIFIGLVALAFEEKTMPDNNTLWTKYLINNGFERTAIPNFCPDCYTVRDFCREHPTGEFLLATGTHVIGVIDGTYYDTSDTGDMIPISYWSKRKE